MYEHGFWILFESVLYVVYVQHTRKFIIKVKIFEIFYVQY